MILKWWVIRLFIQLMCNDPSCEAVNVDLIRCNICTKYVCEKCHDVPVAKLKTVMDRCSTIYFICNSCNNNTTDRTVNLTDDNEKVLTNEMNDGQKDLVAKLQTSVNKTILKLETKLESLINSKIDEKMAEISTFSETIKKQGDTLNKISQSYSDSIKEVQASARTQMDLRQIMQETRNEELVQEREREARAKNIIIHGFNEAGNSRSRSKGGGQ